MIETHEKGTDGNEAKVTYVMSPPPENRGKDEQADRAGMRRFMVRQIAEK